ncbi:MAG: alanine racemase [Thiomicrospira sp.]
MSRPICAEIDLSALRHNLRQVRVLAPHAKIWAVIKANGYGHGVERVAQQVAAADGFAVASLDEALILRQKGFLHRILLLEGVFHPDELYAVEQHRLDMVIHSRHQLDWVLAANISSALSIWLKIDSGMHRLGFALDDFIPVLTKLRHANPKHTLQLMTHFASADDDAVFTKQQLERFLYVAEPTNLVKSLANSAAIQTFARAHADWIRPGIMLYGAGILPRYQRDFIAVLTFKTQLISLKWIEAGEGVGYGQTWRAAQRTLLGIAAAGYGDGYPRHAPSGTPVLVNQQRASLVGRVSMDMITLDLTHLAERVAIGDEVILWGKTLSVDEVAQYAGTIGYELLCGITQRVPIVEVNSHGE